MSYETVDTNAPSHNVNNHLPMKHFPLFFMIFPCIKSTEKIQIWNIIHPEKEA